MFAYNLNLKQMKMKNSKLLLVLLSIFCLACNQEKKVEYAPFSARQAPDKGEKAIVHGKISNLHVYPHVNEVILTLPDFSLTGEMHLSPIDSTGEFCFEIYPVVLREFSLTPIEDRLMIAPGDTLYIEHDFSDITNTRFSGSAAVLNQQITRFRNKYLGRYIFDYNLSYLEFKEKCDKQLEETYDKLERFKDEHNTSELFNLWADKQVRIDYYEGLFGFPLQYFFRTKEEFADKDKEVYYDFLPELKATIDNRMILTDYYKAVSRYAFLETFGYNPMPEEPKGLTMAESIESLTSDPTNPFFSQFAVASKFSVNTQTNSTKEIDENEELFNRLITDPFLRSVLQEEYNRVRDFKDNPVIYSDAVLGNKPLETTGVGVDFQDSVNVVKHLVGENLGNVLYIDVWATWCPPCIVEKAHSLALSDHFEGEPITFIYLCMGGGHEKWKETINKYNLSGIHRYITEEEWQDIVKRFSIKGIPHYLLFNKEGVMVDFGSHLRPSTPQTKIAIEELLEQ